MKGRVGGRGRGARENKVGGRGRGGRENEVGVGRRVRRKEKGRKVEVRKELASLWYSASENTTCIRCRRTSGQELLEGGSLVPRPLQDFIL